MLRPGLLATITAAALLAGCLASGEGAPKAGPGHITLAIAPSAQPGDVLAKAGRLDAHLERALAEQGHPLEVHIAFPSDREALLEGLARGDYDAAVVDVWTASIAQRAVGVKVGLSADSTLSSQGTPLVTAHHFSSYVVLEDAPHSSLKSLRGKRVAYPMEDPLNGYVLPLSELVRQQLVPPAGATSADPRAFFSEVVHVPTYEDAYRALVDRRVDTAVVSTTMPSALEAEARAATRPVATMGPIPGDAVVYRPGFGGAAELAFTEALVSLDAEGADAMRPFVDSRFAGWREAKARDHLNVVTVAVAQTGAKRDAAGP